jgi:hypothetical protein
MSLPQHNIPLEVQHVILQQLYKVESWHLCIEEVPPVNGVHTFRLRPSVRYPTAPLLTSLSWRQYSMSLLERNFSNVLYLDMTNVSAQSILGRAEEREAFVLLDNFEHIYDRVATLRIVHAEVIAAALYVVRPRLPNLDTIQIVERFNPHIDKVDKNNPSFPRDVVDIHDLIQTTICDGWFRHVMRRTLHPGFRFILASPILCDLKAHYQRVFCIEMLQDSRFVGYHPQFT